MPRRPCERPEGRLVGASPVGRVLPRRSIQGELDAFAWLAMVTALWADMSMASRRNEECTGRRNLERLKYVGEHPQSGRAFSRIGCLFG